jgi:serine protease AprX
MRKQNEFRQYPPMNSSAGWGAGSTDKKEGNEQASGPKAAKCGWEVFAALLLAFLMMLAASGASASSGAAVPKVSPPLQKLLNTADPSTVVDVIVQYRVAPQQKHLDRVTSLGGRSKVHLGLIQSEAYTLPLSAVAGLLNDPDVVYVSLDNKVKLTQYSSGSTSSSSVGMDPSLEAINADIAQSYGYTGSGVGIAIVDSGIYAHPDLNSSSRSRVVYSQSFVPGDSSTGDAYGHGTHVAGLALGNGQSSNTYAYDYVGVATNANLINLRVLDANGVGTDSTVISAINQAITLKSTYNIRVMNLSLGRPIFESYIQDPLCQAVEKAWNAGIVVVVAAGNYGRLSIQGSNGYGTITAPGNDPYVITVGAIDANDDNPANDSVASFSSKGPTLIDHIVKPDIVASGNEVASLLAVNATLEKSYPSFDVYPTLNTSARTTSSLPMYFTLSGTSMAAPLVSGTAALMIQKDSTLTPDLVKARLMKAAFKSFPAHSTVVDSLGNTYQEQGDIFTYGAGDLDAAAALKNTDTGSGLALSPTAVYNSKTNTVSVTQTTVSGKSVMWGTSVLWGSSVVWGANVFVNSSSVLWGSSVVWGTSTDTGFSVLWGASAPAAYSTTQGMAVGDPGDTN